MIKIECYNTGGYSQINMDPFINPKLKKLCLHDNKTMAFGQTTIEVAYKTLVKHLLS